MEFLYIITLRSAAGRTIFALLKVFMLDRCILCWTKPLRGKIKEKHSPLITFVSDSDLVKLLRGIGSICFRLS